MSTDSCSISKYEHHMYNISKQILSDVDRSYFLMNRWHISICHEYLSC